MAATSDTFIGLLDAKLPLKSTHTHLVWGCVPVNTRDVQEFSVTNYSQSHIYVQVKSINPEFKLVFQGPHDYELYTDAETWLGPLETNKIQVSFCPSAKGPFPGVLEFTSIDLLGEEVIQQHLRMSGYGGHALVSFESMYFVRNLNCGECCDFFLPFYYTHPRASEFTCTITCINHGDVSAFICSTFQEVCVPFPAAVCIHPDKFVLAPQETISIHVVYAPTGYALDFFEKHIPYHAVALGAFYLIAEAEPLRRRLRQVTRKAEERCFQAIPAIAQNLSGVFQNEQHYPEDVSVLKEDADELEQLLRLIPAIKTVPIVTQA